MLHEVTPNRVAEVPECARGPARGEEQQPRHLECAIRQHDVSRLHGESFALQAGAIDPLDATPFRVASQPKGRLAEEALDCR